MTPRVQRYAEEAGAYFGVAADEILSPVRRAKVVRARWAVMRRLSAAGFSSVQIGRWLQRDHATVLHGLKKAGQSTGSSTGCLPHLPQVGALAPSTRGEE